MATILLLSVCFGQGNNIRRRATAPEEDLTVGVPKTEPKDAKRIHTKLEESSNGSRLSRSQDKASTESKSVTITKERHPRLSVRYPPRFASKDEGFADGRC